MQSVLAVVRTRQRRIGQTDDRDVLAVQTLLSAGCGSMRFGAPEPKVYQCKMYSALSRARVKS